MNKHFLIAIILGVVVFGTLFLLNRKPKEETPAPVVTAPAKLKVSASFYPLAFFAREVGGDKVEVVTVVPQSVEPHDFEPTARELSQVYDSKIFVYNGVNLDPWASQIKNDVEAQGVKTIDMSTYVNVQRNDPHFWLDPNRAKFIVSTLRDQFTQLDSSNSSYYKERAQNLDIKLSTLSLEYENGLALCSQRSIITSHDAFGYLAARYTINVNAITGIDPEGEPDPKRLAELSQLVKSTGIKYIFTETLVSPRVAESLASETGASVLVFNPIEGLTVEEVNRGDNYFTIMQQNLQNLKTALQCTI